MGSGGGVFQRGCCNQLIGANRVCSVLSFGLVVGEGHSTSCQSSGVRHLPVQGGKCLFLLGQMDQWKGLSSPYRPSTTPYMRVLFIEVT